MRPLPLWVLALTLSLLFVLMRALDDPAAIKSPPSSPWVGQNLPQTALPSLDDDQPRHPVSDYNGTIIVNFFASWCVPCRIEHPLFMALNQKDPTITIIGIAYKDKREDALEWLQQEGNPYDEVFFDNQGDASLPWGVIGVPESFIIDSAGIVIHHQRGPFDATHFSQFFGS